MYFMFGELYALATALIRGFSAIPTRKGLNDSNPITSASIAMLIRTIFLWAVLLIWHPEDILKLNDLIFFVLAGLFAPGVAMIFRDTGFKRLGVTITYPIIGTNTFFSMILAVILLGEKATPFLVLGAVLIFGGLLLLTRQEEGVQRSWRKRDLLLPITAALLFAVSVNLRKIGLRRSSSPFLGAAVTSTVSFLVLLVYLGSLRLRRGGRVVKISKDSMIYFLIAGIASGVAFMLYFLSLSASNIIRIQPISSTNPLFSIFFSYFLLREEEKVTSKIISGALLIMGGVFLLFL